MESLVRNLTINLLAANAGAGRYADIPKPPWAMPMLIIAIVTLTVSGIPVFFELGERRRRWVYWGAFLCGTLLMALALSYRGWRTSAAVCGGGVIIAFCFAFFYDSSLLKFRTRQFSYTLPAEHRSKASPIDTYLGVVPVRNHWWLIAVGSCGFAYGIYLIGWAWQITISVAAGVVLAAVSGWDDGARGLPIARRQTVQFVIASLASIMMFGLPLVAYLAGYYGAKKWPIDRGRHTGHREPGELHDTE